MTKKIIFTLTLALALSACSKEDTYPYIPDLSPAKGEKTVSVEVGFDSSGDIPSVVTLPTLSKDDTFSVFDSKQNKVSTFTVYGKTGSSGRTIAAGNLSEGSFLTTAVYPADRMISNLEGDGWTLSVPHIQSIAAGGTMDPDAVCYSAKFSSTDEKLSFSFAPALVCFQVDKPSVGTVEITFTGEDATGYKIRGAFEQGKDYYVAVTPGSYTGWTAVMTTSDGKTSYRSTSSTALSFEMGRSDYKLDSFRSEASARFTIYNEKAFANADAFFEGTDILGRVPQDLQSLIPLLLHINLPKYEDSARLFCFTYPSLDPDGQPVTLSSAIMVPAKALTGELKLKKVVLANHYSIMKNEECPTLSNNIECLLAWKDAAVVMPDYYGFGATADKPQAYLNFEGTARACLDALKAGMALLDSKGVQYEEEIINVGYSQGGYSSVANLAYLSNHPELDITFAQTFAGGGPYNVMDTFSGYLGGGFDLVFPLILTAFYSFNELGHLNIPYSDIFKGRLLENYKEWIVSKKYSVATVRSLLGSTKPEDHLAAPVLSTASATYGKLLDIARKHSLTRGWSPTPGTRLTLIHSNGDDMVPYSNYLALLDYLSNFSGSINLTTKVISGKTHDLTYIDFFMMVVQQGMI